MADRGVTDKQKLLEVLIKLDGAYKKCHDVLHINGACSKETSKRFFIRVSDEIYEPCLKHLEYYTESFASMYYREITEYEYDR